jgi:C_GCAxxG_C_C family probable redox protein
MDQRYEKMVEEATKLGYRNEMEYWGCSQAVVSALIESFGIGGPDMLRISTVFAGGLARRGKTCGALTGGLIVIGFLAGRDDLEIWDQYERGMDYAGKLYQRFEKSFGTTACAEIQVARFGKSFDLLTEEGKQNFYDAGAHSQNGCPEITQEGARLAAEIVVEILQERPLARILASGKTNQSF